jgi:hypothetical protein
MTITIDVQVTNGNFDLFVGDDCGGSGISIKGKSAQETAENLLPYLVDYFKQEESYNE